METQRELRNDIGSISIENGLDQLSDFISFMDIMKNQKRDHEFTQKLEKKYERMLKSPYFGRIDFIEDKEDTTEKCYIGLSNLINEDFDFLIYDWRAPISSMFYDCETGRASYECPEGIISGEITGKRQYKINGGKIEYMFDSNLSIDDEILQELLSENSDDKMKAIVTSIQREQNQVIRNENYKNLIVQGAAGSGKTSVALHRIAYLLYKHRDKITPENIIIFSPNNIFNDYISNVLPQLSEDVIVRNKLVISADEIKKLFYNDFSDLPIKRRLKKLKSRIEFLIEPYREAWINEVYEWFFESGDYIEREEMIEKSTSVVKKSLKDVYNKIAQMTEFNLIEIYKDLFKHLDTFLNKMNIKYENSFIEHIKTYSIDNLNANILNYEDQVAFLYLKCAFGQIPSTSQIKHIIIDEAQDYTPLQYEIYLKIKCR